MAITVQDKAGNATITDSGTVTRVTSPVYVGPNALQFNSSSGGTVTDGNGKISFTIPTGIGTGEFTIQAFISVNSDDGTHAGNHHSDYFIDIGGIQVRFKTSTVSSSLRLAPTAIGYGSYQTATSTGVSPNDYFHFRITRDSSGDIKTWEGNPSGGSGSVEHILATGDTTNMNGVTIEIGDLGSGAGAFRLDSFEIKNSYSQNTPTSYIIPSQDSTAEDVEGDTLVMIDGTAYQTLDGTVTTSASATLTSAASIIHGADTSPSISSSVSVTANQLISVSATLTGSLLIEDSYVEVGYIDETYFIQLIANVFSPADAAISAQSSVSVTAVRIIQGDVSLQINGYVGTQQYVEADYIVGGYFESTVDAELATPGANLVSTVTLTATAEEEGQATLSSSLTIGDFYVVPEYIERSYFVEGVEAIKIAGASVSESISTTLSVDGDVTADGQITMDVQSSMLVTALGTVFDGVVNIPLSSSLTSTAFEITQGEVSVSISGTTSITAIADLAGEVSVAISATTSIQANATSSGDIEPGITVSLTCSAQAFRINPRYTLIIPKETRVNTITQETRQVIIPKETRELEFFV